MAPSSNHFRMAAKTTLHLSIQQAIAESISKLLRQKGLLDQQALATNLWSMAAIIAHRLVTVNSSP